MLIKANTFFHSKNVNLTEEGLFFLIYQLVYSIFMSLAIPKSVGHVCYRIRGHVHFQFRVHVWILHCLFQQLLFMLSKDDFQASIFILVSGGQSYSYKVTPLRN